MHEIRATIPGDAVDEVVKIARAAGIYEVMTSEVFIRGPEAKRILCSIETSTPQAQALTGALLDAEGLKGKISLTSRELRAIVNETPVEEVTRPMGEPLPDVMQDLWQLSHLTWSYVGRALAGGILLATGILEDNPISIVVAAMFLPFLSQVLALGIGLWSGDKKLAMHGLKAVGASMMLAFLGGVAVSACVGGPIGFHGFKGPLSSFVISSVIGITAGLSCVDDVGRRYLVSVAAAVQLAVFPVWLGAAAVIGIPDVGVVIHHLLSFAVNLVTIPTVSAIAYAYAHARPVRPSN